jgi:hypothetical protein
MTVHFNSATGKLMFPWEFVGVSGKNYITNRGKIVPRSALTPRFVKGVDPLHRKAGGTPALDLDFTSNKSLVGTVSGKNLVTFSRASSGTYVGSDGLIKTSLVNLLTYSEQFDQWTVASNSVITPNAAAAPDGTNTADQLYFSATGLTNVSQNITLTQGTTYTFSVYAKAVTPGSNNNFTPYINSSTPRFPTDPFEATSEWVRFSFTFTHTNSTGSVPIFILNKGDEYVTNIYVWGAQLEEGSTATDYIPTTSTISGAPRFDHDPATGESLGLLIEEARTNYISNESVAFSVGVNSTIITPNAFTAPDGSNTATRVQGTNGYVNMSQGKGSVPAGSTITASYYIYSAVEIPACRSRVTYGSGHFDTVKPVPAGKWTRFVCNAKVDDTGNDTTFNFRPFAAMNSFGVSPVDCYIWGFQVEVGSFPTSYIPTATSTVTRAADVAEITGTDFSSWYNQSEGTVFSGASPVPDGERRVYVFSDGTNNVRIGHTAQDNGFSLFLKTNNVTTSLASNLSGLPKSLKACIAYKSGSSSGVIDGVLKDSSTTPNVPNTINQLSLGSQNFSSDGYLNGHISRLTYFPTRLPDATLQNITS